jgi:hypothetical protein
MVTTLTFTVEAHVSPFPSPLSSREWTLMETILAKACARRWLTSTAGRLRRLTTWLWGTEVLVENRALRVAAKAVVIKLGKKQHARDLHPVVLRLLEAQNVWGITFPPDDWRPNSAG